MPERFVNTPWGPVPLLITGESADDQARRIEPGELLAQKDGVIDLADIEFSSVRGDAPEYIHIWIDRELTLWERIKARFTHRDPRVVYSGPVDGAPGARNGETVTIEWKLEP